MKILRIQDVKNITGLSSATIWRMEKSGAFPLRRQIGPHSVGWLSSELLQWIESRPTAREVQHGQPT
jgi:prophage regulatory protein